MNCSQLMFPYGDWRDLCSASTKTRSFDTTWFGVQSQSNSVKSQVWGWLDSKKDFDSVDSKQSEASYDESSRSVPVEHKKIFICERVDRSSTYVNRRDVINKTIIRHFHKRIKVLFTNIILKRKSTYSIDSLKWKIYELWIEFKLIQEMSPDNQEVIEFILWVLYQNKKMKSKRNYIEVLKKYFAAVGEDRFESIQIMSDILKGYGHTKLQRLFENNILRIVFKRLLEMESENFLSQIPVQKRAKAVEALRDFKTNINLNN